VILPLALVIVVLTLALAVWAALRAAADKPVVFRQLWAAAVIEAVLLIEVVVAVVVAVGGRVPKETATFWGYAVTGLVILPFAGVLAFAERTRWSSVVLLIATATVAIMQYRMLQTWGI
jgi:uncharacterized membrane protein YkvI